MSILPVIERELRSQARQPLTFLLRLAGAGSICLAFWLAYSSLRLPATARYAAMAPPPTQVEFQNFGMALFGKMNLTIFIGIWLLTPLAAADSISRERREGTLPLLHLTRLKSWEIVMGKSFVHLLRSSTLFLTMLPWLLVPLLFGGLSAQDFLLALLLDLSALLLAQSAGLLASTFCRDWLKAVIWAEALALALLLLMMSLYQGVLNNAISGGAGPLPSPVFGIPRPPGIWSSLRRFEYSSPNGFVERHEVLLGLLTNGTMEYQYRNPFWYGGPSVQPEFRSTWQELWAILNPQGEYLWLMGAAGILSGSAAVFIASIFLGARYVKWTWRGSKSSARFEHFRQKYFQPKYGVTVLRRSLSRSLNRNPIGWLHHYSTSARLTKWSWCLFLILIETCLAGNIRDLYTAQDALGYLLLVGLVFSSTGSFRDELETGAFELLLVTPLREGQILLGRVIGIWQQFLPAFIIYVAGSIFLGSGWADQSSAAAAVESALWFTLLFLAAPFIGLYFSLRRWNFLLAWMGACCVALVLPWMIRAAGLSGRELMIAQFSVAAICALLTWKRLQNRLALSQTVQEAKA